MLRRFFHHDDGKGYVDTVLLVVLLVLVLLAFVQIAFLMLLIQ